MSSAHRSIARLQALQRQILRPAAGAAPTSSLAAVHTASSRRLSSDAKTPDNGWGPQLASKTAVITGAGSGIGRKAAILFASHGAKVLAVDWNHDGLEQVKQEVDTSGGVIEILKADVSSETDSKRIIETCVEKFGVPDVYFANAGIAGMSYFMDITAEDFTKILKVNVLGTFLGLKTAAIAMKDAGKEGSLIATASVAGIRSGAGDTAYSASKAAVINMVQTMANQLKGTGIRINAVCPGLTETGMTQPLFDLARAKGREGKIGQLNPLNRYGVAEEVASVGLFLASAQSSYVNGQAIAVCGGLSSSHPTAPGKFY